MSSTITIEIPTSLRQAVTDELGESALPRWTAEAIVLEGVREGLLSIGEACEFLGLGYFQTEAFLKEKGVPVVISDEEFEQEQADLRQIAARSPLR